MYIKGLTAYCRGRQAMGLYGCFMKRPCYSSPGIWTVALEEERGKRQQEDLEVLSASLAKQGCWSCGLALDERRERGLGGTHSAAPCNCHRNGYLSSGQSPAASGCTLPCASIPFCPPGTLWWLPRCFYVLLSLFVVT